MQARRVKNADDYHEFCVGNIGILYELFRLDLDADFAHKRQGIEALALPRLEDVVEAQLVSLDISVEVKIPDLLGDFLFKPGELQVVGGDNPRGLESDQLPHQGQGSRLPVQSIGPLEHLVQEIEHILAPEDDIQDLL